MWFEWLLTDESRYGVFLAACIIAIFMAAAAAMIDLFWEMLIAAIVGLVTAAQYGFFLATLAFAVAFVALFEWSGRKVRVKARYLPSR